jgi:hypothetical protein
MKCPNCGKPVRDGDTSCGSCQAQVARRPSPEEPSIESLTPPPSELTSDSTGGPAPSGQPARFGGRKGMVIIAIALLVIGIGVALAAMLGGGVGHSAAAPSVLPSSLASDPVAQCTNEIEHILDQIISGAVTPQEALDASAGGPGNLDVGEAVRAGSMYATVSYTSGDQARARMVAFADIASYCQETGGGSVFGGYPRG